MKEIYTILTPHNPLLISKIGGEHSEKLKKSITAWKYIRQKIYSIDPEKIIIIMPEYSKFNNISINQCQSYKINFKEFGDLSIEFEVNGDLDFSTRLKYYLRKNDFPVSLFSDSEINYKSFVPLYYLNKYHISSKGFEKDMKHEEVNTEFIMINCSSGDLAYHTKFGELLSNFIEEANERIVLIACGDFIKEIKEENIKQTEELLEVFIDSIKKKKYNNIFKHEEEFKNGTYPGLKPFVAISHNLSHQKSIPNILSLDREFNEIYLTCEFE
jgi:aromatic ring-opening dioxygenase catalytic subunit (LigB family)